jgi:hypothetical protein
MSGRQHFVLMVGLVQCLLQGPRRVLIVPQGLLLARLVRVGVERREGEGRSRYQKPVEARV